MTALFDLARLTRCNETFTRVFQHPVRRFLRIGVFVAILCVGI